MNANRLCLSLGALLASGCASTATVPAAPPEFPVGWEGTWRGSLRSAGGSSPMEVEMTLEVRAAEAGTWAWVITYAGPAGTQVRDYRLIARDAARGQYEIDERNGIILPVRWLDGVLLAEFEVQGSRVTVREELRSEESGLLVEMATFAAGAPSTTGGGAAPEVRGWAPVSLQRGTLRRVRR
jgi:hypothetical protein